MSKILITGMTAQQCSPIANSRGVTFSSLIKSALISAGHEVDLKQVDVGDETIHEYDKVLVGLAPMTSLGANYVYGALHAMHAIDKSKLFTFIDAPEPSRIKSSLKAIVGNPSNLSKTLHSGRKGYAETDFSQALAVCNDLYTARWPETLYPSLPWGHSVSALSALPSGSHDVLTSISLDAFIEVPNVETSKVDKWVADTPKSNWTSKIAAQLILPVVPMKWHKGWTDLHISEQIASSVGSIISPHRGGTWWTPRYMQSLLLGTPVATDWHESSTIGDSWAVLPAGIEAMSPGERYNLAMHQLSTYLAHTPKKSEAVEKLETTLGLR